MFHHDLIISKAEREWNIVLWSITGFNSKHPPPSPLTAPTVHDMDNDTRSAFSPPSSPMYSRLLQFSIPDTDVMFMRFGFYPGNPDPRFGGGLSGPVLAMCNSSSKVLFFDFRRLEEHHDYIQALENTTAATQALPSATDSTSPAKANSIVPDIKRPPFLIPFKSRNRGGSSHIRAIDRIAASHGSPSGSERSTTMPEEKEKSTAAADEKKSRENWGHRYFIGDSQKDLLPHKEEMVKGLNFVGRQIAWSTGGEWCVVVGSAGVISIFERWGGK
ncbi:hypothetical protein B0O99DRAFT_628635 [Bisporella sp. PMI_857]|nr:hypothetical protein B0O99DRAFT_628635 [Bisporella sp. PMI_857]